MLWLREVRLARKDYDKPDDDVTRQAIAQRKVMQTFLNIDGPLVPTTPRDRPVATQDNRITTEAQVAATSKHFGPPKERRRRPPSIVTNATILLQRTLWEYRHLF